MLKIYTKSRFHHRNKGLYTITILSFIIIFSVYFYHTDGDILLNTFRCNIGLTISGLIFTSLAIFDDFNKKIKSASNLSILLKILLIIYAGLIGYVCSQKKDILNDKNLLIQKQKSDSLQQTLTKALQDSERVYNKRLNDSVKAYNKNTNGVIVKISGQLYKSFLTTSSNIIVAQKSTIDSLKEQLSKNNNDYPELVFDTIKSALLPKNTFRFTIVLSNRKAEARAIKFKGFYLLYNNYAYSGGNNCYFSLQQLVATKSKTTIIDVRPQPDPEDTYFLYFKGTYEDKNGNQYKIDELFSIDCRNLKVAEPQGSFYDIVMTQMILKYPELKR